MILKPQFVTNEKGRKIFVVLSMKEFNWLIDKIDELEDNKLYNRAKKKDNGERILLKDYIKIRNKKSKLLQNKKK